MDRTGIEDRAARRNLWLLMQMRWIAICGQIAAIGFVDEIMDVPLPLREMATVSAFLVVVNLFSVLRLRVARAISHTLVAVEVLLDVTALTVLLYLSGGATNPFVSLFILQVIVAAVLLPILWVMPVFVAAVAAHWWLLGNGLPLQIPHNHAGGPDFFNTHLQGMFLSFFLAASLLVYFMIRMRDSLEQRGAELAAVQHQMIEEDHLVRIGLLSSGTAHELGTPLTTLAVTLDDWAAFSLPEGEDGRRDVARMLAEVARCREILSRMLLASGQERLDAARAVLVADLLRGLADNWAVGRGCGAVPIQGDAQGASIMADPMFDQAIATLLDNAEAAAPSTVSMNVVLDDVGLRISVADRGPGFPPDILARPGAAFQSTHPEPGRGLGLYLVRNVMRRMNGRLILGNTENGACVTLYLPILPIPARLTQS